MTDTLAALREALDDDCLLDDNDRVEYLEKVLNAYADHVAATEPYAMTAINCLRGAAMSVSDIHDYFEEDAA